MSGSGDGRNVHPVSRRGWSGDRCRNGKQVDGDWATEDFADGHRVRW